MRLKSILKYSDQHRLYVALFRRVPELKSIQSGKEGETDSKLESV